MPSSSGQAKVIREAILTSGVDVQSIRYVEMHGSGTTIGDALEFQGLQQAFANCQGSAPKKLKHSRSSTSARSGQSSVAGSRSASRAPQQAQPVFVGSNKGNFGNSEAASGLTSLIKATLVHKGVVPPMRRLGDVNELVSLDRSLIQPLRSYLKLNTGDRVGITALGYGGVNAHCIITSANSIV